MYNKLFTKILDSSIWLESTPTRMVWITMLAAMDEDGMCLFASVANLAHRARITKEEAEIAVACLEGEDPDSSDPENEGRRIERVPGGWIVLNASKYRELVTREVAKERTKARVAKHRAARNAKPSNVTVCNAGVTPSNGQVTQSEAEADTHTEADTEADNKGGAGNPESAGVSRGKPKVSDDLLLEPEELPKRQKARGTLAEVTEFCLQEGLLQSDAEAFFHGKEANGWKNGTTAIKDWKATIRSWKAAGYHPSQKAAAASYKALPESVRATREGRLYPGPKHVNTTVVPDDV